MTPAEAQAVLTLGPPEPFSFELLKEKARLMAGQPYRPPMRPAPEIVSQLNYEEWGKITFNTDAALFAEGPGRLPVTFFHLGMFFAKSVDMLVVADGRSREIIYDQSMFNIPPTSPAQHLPKGIGFAGFRVQEPRDGTLDWRKNDWAAFLGASYFRAIGELYQYGQSARGIAIDVAVADRDEEFPDFTKFYIETPTQESGTMVVHALLDGPSVTGAYRFTMTRAKGVVMDIEHTLHLRKDVARLGIAPLTTMYWYSETMKEMAIDWRPEVHDSDGLSLWTGAGERLWRALNNPDRTTASAFSDRSPKGYGTMQRDRIFDHYIDGVYYDRRPSVWVEPLGDWGKGAVQLVEIPTDDEIHDNVVAMWVPDEPATAGEGLCLFVQAALARRRAVSAGARPLRRDAARTRRPARLAAPTERAQVHGRVPGWPAGKLAVRYGAAARRVDVPRRIRPIQADRSRAGWRQRALANAIRSHRGRQGSGRDAMPTHARPKQSSPRRGFFNTIRFKANSAAIGARDRL